MIYKVYILYSNSLLKYYIGFTSIPLEERLKKHTTKHGGFTGRTNDWQIVYFEEYLTKSEAMKREKEIKSWKSRIKIEELIKK